MWRDIDGIPDVEVELEVVCTACPVSCGMNFTSIKPHRNYMTYTRKIALNNWMKFTQECVKRKQS